MILLAAVGAAVGAVNAAIGPIMMSAVPRELMGRVIAVFAPAQQVASITSAGLASWLVATALDGVTISAGPITFGRLDLTFTVAGVLFIVGALYSAVVLRAYKEEEQEAVVEEPAAA